jgi:pimeloyl-ACP methyl ester carboxylesterase
LTAGVLSRRRLIACALPAALAGCRRPGGGGPPAPFPGRTSRWNDGHPTPADGRGDPGFVRHDFEHAGRPAIVVLPARPAPGRPWLWRAEFFGAFPSVDRALLARGWHLAFLNCRDTFGSEPTLDRWDSFYDRLTGAHQLARRPVLLGMSRGALYAYRWAARRPDRVGAIYGDAPVCDVKSWPAGLKSGQGAPREWKRFQEVFGLTEAQAVAWRGNPIDLLEPIARARIPIIHVVGDADETVPVPENTDVLKARYEALGGKVTVIVKKGVGHHPHSLEDPTPVVQFILTQART